MSITNYPDADFTPDIPNSGANTGKQSYNPTGSFRFWAQKVLPTVYDDSLSYYEILTKVVNYLNSVIQNVDSLNDSVDNTNSAFDALQGYVNSTKDTIIGAYNELQSYVNTYFDSLDVQEEINAKLDDMASDGSLSELLAPFIPDLVTNWLNAHVNPVGSAVIVDDSLSITGAAADAKATGDIKNALNPLYVGDNLIDSAVIVSRTITATNNGDGTWTITNSTGRALFGKDYKKVHLKSGETYKLYGVPAGYSFVAKEHELSGMIVKNETSNDKIFTVTETDDYYVGFRLNTSLENAITITPYLLADNTHKTSLDIIEIKSFVSETEYRAKINWMQNGWIVNATGEIHEAGNNWLYSDYIDVSAVKQIRIEGTTIAGSNEFCAIYDANKTYIRGFNTNPTTIILPSNAKYVRVSWNTYTDETKVYLLYEENRFKEGTLNNIYYDSVNIKAQLNFEAGGINNDTGKNYAGQENRIRTVSLCYTEQPLIVCRGDDVDENYYQFKVFFWSDGNFANPKSSDSGWIHIPNTYTIPEKSYFRIVVHSPDLDTTITDVKTSLLFKAINITNKYGKTLNDLTYNGQLSDVASLNIDMLPFVQSLKSTYPTLAQSSFSSTHKPLTFAHFSDIHNRPILWERIAKYVDANSAYLTFALHTGDYVEDNQTAYTDLYAYYMPEVPFLNCVGNHDTFSNVQHTIASKQSAYEKLFNHTSNWGVTFMPGDYSMTYYKDFEDSNIRLIVLDNYYDIAAQKTWLAQILSEAKSLGYHVITASHQVTGLPYTKIDCTFQTLIPYENIGTMGLTEFDSVIGDFISGGGKHVVHLCGHQHQDFFFKTSNGVLNYAIECATNWIGWTEGARVEETKTWDCFNAVGVDADLGIIKLVRIGANCDSHNRAKNILSYDYINGTVLSNE